MSDSSRLVRSRGHIRVQVTKQNTNVNVNLFAISRVEKQQLIGKFRSMLSDLKSLNEQIQELKWTEINSENTQEYSNELETCDSYEDKILQSIALLEDSLSTPTGNGSHSQLVQPVVPLPKFESKPGESIEKFLTSFESVVSKNNYEDYPKFLLLKRQISGRASYLIDSLETSKQSYKHAKDLLEKALASPQNLKYEAIQRLVDLKLTYETDPFYFISEFSIIKESFTSLKIDIDMILQYFVWNGLNDTFRNQLVNITSKDKPTLNEIETNYFQASERYSAVTKKFNEHNRKVGTRPKLPLSTNPKSTLNMAVNVGSELVVPRYPPCVLCNKGDVVDDHPIYKCIKFESPADKVREIERLKGCVKCGYLSHEISNCKFRFKSKCKFCGRYHFSYLCQNKPNSNSEPKSKKAFKKKPDVKPSSQESSYTVWSKTLFSSLNGGSVLPSFTGDLMSGKRIRGMKDTCCQVNFVTERLAKEQNFDIVRDNFQVIVNGFNTQKEYSTNIVRFKIKLGKQCHILEAICVPSIDVCLKLPHLGNIVSEFTNKGYTLADKFLTNDSEEISDVNLVLGAEASYCIPDNTVLFGNSPPSVYCNSDIGVMLMGNTGVMVRNLDFLPSAIQLGVCSASEPFQFSDIKGDSHDSSETESNLDKLLSDKFETRLGNLEFVIDDLHKDLIERHSLVEPFRIDAHFSVLSESGQINEAELKRATDDILDRECKSLLHYEKHEFDSTITEKNKDLVKYVISNTDRSEDGRLEMPLLWNEEVSHLLGENFNLSKQILKSNLKKLTRNNDYLKMTDEVFKDQEQMGIIERLGDLDKFREEHPNASFLPHMSVIKMKRETTKCRVVYLSNLAEKCPSKPLTLSHNQTIYPGPNLNQNLTICLLQLRFGRNLLCFDLVKAFLMIGLREVDQNRLLFLWYRNISKGDFTIVGYKMKRLAFGLTCSPCILMLALYRILILDSEEDDDSVRALKHLVYALSYMDNGAYATDDPDSLEWAYLKLGEIFAPYKIALQQYVTNHLSLQKLIDETQGETQEKVKLFGIQWNRVTDSFSTNKFHLNLNANTKRLILRSIAENFDPMNFNGPLLNRARIFMHELQTNRSLNWDTELPNHLINEWINISRQLNAAPEISIKRFVGRRDGRYRLLAFSDSSKTIYGTVLFIQDLDTLEVNFLLAKNRLVCKQLQTKTIPSLEFQALVLGAETLVEIYRGLTGDRIVVPINIEELHVFTDSMICIDWINAYVNKFDKLYQKRSIFLLNRLDKLSKLCQDFPVKFSFVQGGENPADAISRPLSYKQLVKSRYFSGPQFLKDPSIIDISNDIPTILVPNPHVQRQGNLVNNEITEVNSIEVSVKPPLEHLIPIERYSNFYRLVVLHRLVLLLINRWKLKLKARNPKKYEHIHCFGDDTNFHALASRQIISRDQSIHFQSVFDYFKSRSNKLKDMPDIVSRFNVYPDSYNVLRVNSKCQRGTGKGACYFPVFLAKESLLSKLIIQTKHELLAHLGKYALLHELKKEFYVPQYFSLVKSILKNCVVCKRLNARPIKLNQSPYRDFRLDPKRIPFSYLFLDFLGPYTIKKEGKKSKAYILCLTCLWSRSVNLQVTYDLTVDSFLRVFQLHVFQHGLPEKVFSDLGSQIVAASNIIKDYLKDPATHNYMDENGIQMPSFEQYYKGNSSLGSVVEICVKMIKRLLFGFIRNNVLIHTDFEFFVSQTLCLINKRPIAFQEALRDSNLEGLPEIITPELLLKGYHTNVFNIIPKLHPSSDSDPDWSVISSDELRDEYSKLKKIRSNLHETYNNEFISNLISQAVSKRDRYKPVKHNKIKPGDVVLIQQKYLKSMNYPLGIVKTVKSNSLGEVTGASVVKGGTGEVTYRHVNSLIPLLSNEQNSPVKPDDDYDSNSFSSSSLPKRQAAIKGLSRIRTLLHDESI